MGTPIGQIDIAAVLQLKAVLPELASLREKVKTSDLTIEHLKSSISSLETARAADKASLKALETSISDIPRIAVEHANLQKNYITSQDMASSALNAVTKELEVAKSELKEEKSRRVQLQEAHDGLKTLHESTTTTMRQRIEKLTGDLPSRERLVEELQSRLAETRNRLSEVSNQKAGLEEAFAAGRAGMAPHRSGPVKGTSLPSGGGAGGPRSTTSTTTTSATASSRSGGSSVPGGGAASTRTSVTSTRSGTTPASAQSQTRTTTYGGGDDDDDFEPDIVIGKRPTKPTAPTSTSSSSAASRSNQAAGGLKSSLKSKPARSIWADLVDKIGSDDEHEALPSPSLLPPAAPAPRSRLVKGGSSTKRIRFDDEVE